MNKLFVYGIFLDEERRQRYGMKNPRYAVVEGWKTEMVRGGIVEAVPDKTGALTGLVVDVDPKSTDIFGTEVDNWLRLDSVEEAYDRIRITTFFHTEAWMYVRKGIK